MSVEEGKAGTRPTEVSVDDFLEWLVDRQANDAACPMCSYTKWNLLTGDDNLSLVGMNVYPATVGNMGWGKPLIQLECQRCAYLAVFPARTIAEWVSLGKPPFSAAPTDDE